MAQLLCLWLAKNFQTIPSRYSMGEQVPGGTAQAHTKLQHENTVGRSRLAFIWYYHNGTTIGLQWSTVIKMSWRQSNLVFLGELWEAVEDMMTSRRRVLIYTMVMALWYNMHTANSFAHLVKLAPTQTSYHPFSMSASSKAIQNACRWSHVRQSRCLTAGLHWLPEHG